MQKLIEIKIALTQLAPLPDKLWITSNDCLNALLWLYVTRARLPDISRHWKETSYISAVNVRSRMEPVLLPLYMGNATLLAQTSRPLEAFYPAKGPELLPYTADLPILRELALAIRQSIIDVDAKFVRERLQFFHQTSNPTKARYGFRNYLGPDFFNTSWSDFGASLKWAIPGTLTELPAYSRKPYIDDDGSSVILPRRKDHPQAPYEIWVQLQEDHMAALESSLRPFVERIA
jgi:hypothetical protein